MPLLSRSTDSSQNLFISGVKRNRVYLMSVAIAIILQFSAFKFFYLFPNFIHDDSFVFIRAAYNNESISLHPIGYSKFLRLFSVFSTSDLALTAFQYLLMQVSAIAFIFTIFHFYRPGKLIQVLLITAMVLNPIFLHLANLISSDGIFIALSFVWLTLLLWILHHPTSRLSACHAIVLFLAFTVRYNALYYPLISTVVYILSKQKLFYKLSGIGAGLILIGGFIYFTSLQYKAFIQTQVFSPFTGWQLANNALYAYRRVDSAERKPAPLKFQEVDRLVKTYLDSSKNLRNNLMEILEASSVYMWDTRSPLQKFMMGKYSLDASIVDSATRKYQRWASAGPFLGEYGTWLIKKYPLKFAENYLCPNAMKYFAPPLEFLGRYNMGRSTISPIVQTWFKLKTTKVKTKFRDIRASSLSFYPIFSGIVNGLFIFCILSFYFMHGFKQQAGLSRLILPSGMFWLFNLLFSIFASPIALRYQVFPLYTFLSISLIIFEFIYKSLSEKEKKAIINRPDLEKAIN